MGINFKGANREVLGDDGNVQYLDCDIGYLNVGIVKTHLSIYFKKGGLYSMCRNHSKSDF